MRIALVGANGQLGRELRRQLGERAIPLNHAQIELTNPESVSSVINAANPDLVINAAAYNQVDLAEDEPEQAFAVNALGPRNLAHACSTLDVALVHVSTDYVFSGYESPDQPRSRPYGETDPPQPLSAYGSSKLAGELFVRSLCRRHFVIRTCGLFGPTSQPGRGNFVQTMMRLGRERGDLKVVDDQRCCPTATADLARAIEVLCMTEQYGLYHVTNAGAASWCEFACEIFRLAQTDVKVTPITSAEFGAKATRPCYSVLDCGKLADVTGFTMPPWQDAVAQYLDSDDCRE